MPNCADSRTNAAPVCILVPIDFLYTTSYRLSIVNFGRTV